MQKSCLSSCPVRVVGPASQRDGSFEDVSRRRPMTLFRSGSVASGRGICTLGGKISLGSAAKEAAAALSSLRGSLLCMCKRQRLRHAALKLGRSPLMVPARSAGIYVTSVGAYSMW